MISYRVLQPRYKHVKYINLEFAQDIEDKHFESLKSKVIFPIALYRSLVPFFHEFRRRCHYGEEMKFFFKYNIIFYTHIDTCKIIYDHYHKVVLNWSFLWSHKGGVCNIAMPFSFKSSNQYFKLEIQVNEIHVEIFFVLRKSWDACLERLSK